MLEQRSSMSYAKALIVAAVLNAVMVVVEVGGALYANSIALMANAIDSLEDAITYALAISLIGLGRRARAFFGALTVFLMVVPTVWIALKTLEQLREGFPPEPLPMGAIGLASLAVNFYCAFLLMPHRQGDSAHQDVWASTRMDVFACAGIVLAAVATAFSSSIWPDVLVGFGIAALNLSVAAVIGRNAWRDWTGRDSAE
jgi:Co/Zn/Cd efflux system component